MHLSAEGRAKIEGYEGFHVRLPDGSCKAYQEYYNGKPDKPTIGFGCTEGVTLGMVWTREQADAAFAKELAKFEDAVTRFVTVPLNQNQFDALVSFSYNVGVGALKASSLLKKLNKGDYKGAAAQFQFWNHAGGGVVAGLTQRRASEANLFMKPTEPLPLPAMPQSVEKRTELSKLFVAGASAVCTSVGAVVPQTDPIGAVQNFMDTGQRLKGISEQGKDLAGWASHGVPLPVFGAVAFCVAAYFIVCHWLPSFTGKSQ